MPPIALALIVRNEAPTITQTLESARRALGPGPTIVHDTGSTDGTQGVALAWAGREIGRRLALRERPFDDFSSARNACLAEAWKASPIVCMVDAGVIVSGTWTPPEHVHVPDAWTALIHLGKITYARPQVFTKGWRYEGKVHECTPEPKGARVHVSGLTFDYCLRDAERPKRWLRDLALLEGDMSPRGRFYYAQTLDLVGRKTQALVMYLERAAMHDGFWQERVVAYMRCVPLAPTIAEAERYAAAALTLDPSRGDVYLDLCERYEERKDWPAVYAFATRAILTVPRTDAMFARTDREARANMYAGDAASSQGKYALAREHWLRALAVGGLDESDRLELEAAVA